MSVCGHNGHSEDKNTTDDFVPSGHDSHKEKPASKLVRVLTVLAYLLSVSLAAILLSIYYVCVWKSPELPPLNDTKVFARRAPPHSIMMERLQSPGGGDIPVNQNISYSTNNFTTPTNRIIPTTPSNETNRTLSETEDFQVSTYNNIANDTGSLTINNTTNNNIT